MRNFKELQVWRKAHRMVLSIYHTTRTFPSDERFGLVSQLRRAAASVPANIAEGCGRDSNRDFTRFLSIATGSASETEYHILLAHDLHLVKREKYLQLDQQINEVKRMLIGLMIKLKR